MSFLADFRAINRFALKKLQMLRRELSIEEDEKWYRGNKRQSD